MTPKEKSIELFDKYFNKMRLPSDCEGCMQCVDRCESMVVVAKRYSLIAVDEILDIVCCIYSYDSDVLYPYWQKVKQEIEKL